MTKYYRPQSLIEALRLLNTPKTIPLAGGTFINSNFRGQYNLIDLQSVGLEKIIIRNKKIEVGSTAKLQQLFLSETLPDPLRIAIQLEAPLNVRNSASIGGLLRTCDGRSPVATSLLALDAKIILEPNHEELLMANFFATRSNFPQGSLITAIILPIEQFFSFAHVARTPLDRPVVCAALSTWANGRTRLALGGFGNQPILVADGQILDDFAAAARSAYSDAEDDWASAEYRSEMAGVLSNKCLTQINSNL